MSKEYAVLSYNNIITLDYNKYADMIVLDRVILDNGDYLHEVWFDCDNAIAMTIDNDMMKQLTALLEQVDNDEWDYDASYYEDMYGGVVMLEDITGVLKK